MAQTPAQTQMQAREPLTGRNKAGLMLAGALGALSATSVFFTPGDDADSAGPPIGVLVADGMLGLITVVAVVYTWRTANRTGSRVVAGSRILSAVTSLPAFFVDDVPALVVVLVALLVVLTAVATALVLSRPAPDDAVARPGNAAT